MSFIILSICYLVSDNLYGRLENDYVDFRNQYTGLHCISKYMLIIIIIIIIIIITSPVGLHWKILNCKLHVDLNQFTEVYSTEKCLLIFVTSVYWSIQYWQVLLNHHHHYHYNTSGEYWIGKSLLIIITLL